MTEERRTEMNRERKTVKLQTMDVDRGQWASKTEYVLVVAGNVVGLGNVWRFPYLCYKNGGGAFLVPYTLFAVVFGIPLFLMEISFGQYTQEGFITCWDKLCLLAKGIGYGFFMIKVYGFGYILVQVWALFYFIFSFKSQLPWASCDNPWNTVDCVDLLSLNSSNVTVTFTNTTSAATEFWKRRVLNVSAGVEELGSIRWELALCLLLSWLMCYFSIWKGIKSSGKVAYFTATFPYVMLLILFIRGLTLPGAWDGIYYYLYPDINRLANLEVWMEASSQIYFSYSLVVGTLSILGSYNNYHNNCYKDCFWLCLLNSGTSFVAGFVVFSVLGFMAQKQGADRLLNIIEDMTGQKPSVYFKLCWKYIIPPLSLISFILHLVDYKHLKIDEYVYPDWAHALGWSMTLSSVLLVPLWAAGQLCFTPGTFRQRLHILCRPTADPTGLQDTTE